MTQPWEDSQKPPRDHAAADAPPSLALRAVLETLDPAPPDAPHAEGRFASASPELVSQWVARLRAEVAVREETIRFLSRSAALPLPPFDPARFVGIDLDHVQETIPEPPAPAEAPRRAEADEPPEALRRRAADLEQALAAQKADWESLQQWVVAVERKIEASGLYDAVFNDDADGEVPPPPDALLAPSERADPGPLAAERDRLAQERDRLAAELEDERAERVRLAQANEVLKKNQDAIAQAVRKERAAHQAALAQAKAEREAPRTPATLPPERTEALEADERIRAFRQHLAQIHDEESEGRGKGRRGLFGLGTRRKTE